MVSLFTVGIRNMAANSPRKKKCFNKSHLKTASDVPHSGSLTTGIRTGSLLPGFCYDEKYLPNTVFHSSKIPALTKKKPKCQVPISGQISSSPLDSP